MSRRKRQPAIVVEAVEPLDDAGRAWHERWMEAGRRLHAQDPVELQRIMRLCWAFVALYERPNESREAFNARMARITDTKGDN